MLLLPNLLTLARLLAAPVGVWLMLDGEMTAAFWLFVAAGLSDGVDGFLAKRFDARTELGAYLDPLADKTLLVSAFVTLGYLGHLPAWLVILATFRDVMIVGGAALEHAITQSFRGRPTLVSKLNTGLQIALVAVVLAALGLGLEDRGVARALIYAVAATTVASGAQYLVSWARRVAGAQGSP